MASLSLDLDLLFEQAFGYRSSAFNRRFTSVNSRPNRKEISDYGTAYYASDGRGNEYYLPVAVLYDDASAENNPPAGVEDTSQLYKPRQKWQLPHPVISVNCGKKIIETALTDRNGTVKEMVTTMDLQITIRGLLIGHDGNLPEAEINKLWSLFELNKNIQLECALTDPMLLRAARKGSDNVVITNLQLPEIVGVKNVRPYLLQLKSDEPFNLKNIS
jgi:hypothetical protein